MMYILNNVYYNRKIYIQCTLLSWLWKKSENCLLKLFILLLKIKGKMQWQCIRPESDEKIQWWQEYSFVWGGEEYYGQNLQSLAYKAGLCFSGKVFYCISSLCHWCTYCTRGFVHLTKSKTFQLFSSQYAAWYTCTHSIRRINSYTSNSFFYWIVKHSKPLLNTCCLSY